MFWIYNGNFFSNNQSDCNLHPLPIQEYVINFVCVIFNNLPITFFNINGLDAQLNGKI